MENIIYFIRCCVVFTHRLIEKPVRRNIISSFSAYSSFLFGVVILSTVFCCFSCMCDLFFSFFLCFQGILFKRSDLNQDTLAHFDTPEEYVQLHHRETSSCILTKQSAKILRIVLCEIEGYKLFICSCIHSLLHCRKHTITQAHIHKHMDIFPFQCVLSER